MPRKMKIEKGDKYGRLTIIKELKPYYSPKGNHYRKVLCECKCGNKKELLIGHLRTGKTRSCGCLASEKISKRNITHNKTNTSEFWTWQTMKARCLNKNNKSYKNYGERGIKVCKKWLKFENFYKDMGDKPTSQHSIDRIDNNGNYEPSNCRWATKKEQCNNRRTNRLLTYAGKTKTISKWAKEVGINRITIHYRLKRGWSIEKTLTKKVH